MVLESKLNNGSIDDVISALEATKKERSENLAHLLYGFSSKGLYGSYFKPGKAPVFNSKLVCFELSKIKQQKHLQKVVMMTIMFVINGAIYSGDRREFKSIIVDEAWDLLGGEEIAKFLGGLARRIRKYGGNLITGTQGVNDYYANEGSRACWDNSDWRIFMAQKEESIDLLKKDKKISVTKGQIEVLKSIKTSKFGEFVIMGTDLFTVARLMCDLYSVMLYSTKKEHFQRVKDLVAGGMAITDAVEQAKLEFFGEGL